VVNLKHSEISTDNFEFWKGISTLAFRRFNFLILVERYAWATNNGDRFLMNEVLEGKRTALRMGHDLKTSSGSRFDAPRMLRST
jgi:hypothetical protein